MLPALIIIILCGLLGLKHQLTNYDVASPEIILCGLLSLKHQLTNYNVASPDIILCGLLGLKRQLTNYDVASPYIILCGLLGLKHQLTNYDVAHHYVLIGPSQSSRTYDFVSPQWGAADAEINVPSGKNTELKRSPFKAWSSSVYSHTCYAYCQEFLPCLFLPVRSIHLHFFPKPLRIFSFLCRPAG